MIRETTRNPLKLAMRLNNLIDSWRYGLFVQRVLERLRRAGLEIVVYQWVAEGECDPPISPKPADLDLRPVFLDDSHIGQIAATRKWIVREELIRRLQGGQLCIGVFIGDKLAAYMWVDPFECNHPPNRAPLSAGEAYLYEAYSLPEFRGRDVAPFMRRSAYDLLRSRGFNRFYSITDYFNASAARFKQKLGARPICLYLYLKLGARWSGNWKIHTYGAGA